MVPRFARALRALTLLFQQAAVACDLPLRFAVIGGLAVSAWGKVRATQDIDILADSDPSPIRDHAVRARLQQFWDAQGCRGEWRVGLADDPIALLLHLGLPRPIGLTADVLWAQKPWQQEALKRVRTVKVFRTDIVILHPEDLILLKLEAGGPQDVLDVESILANNPPELDHARLMRAATRLRLRTALDKCLRRVAGQ